MVGVCRLTIHGAPELEQKEYTAVWSPENHQQGRCLRELERINAICRPNGLFVARMDKRYTDDHIKKWLESAPPSDEYAMEGLRREYFLPRAAMQGLSITARQALGVLDEAPVDDRLGPFARNKDGGEVVTAGEGLGEFPELFNITQDTASRLKPFWKLHTDAAEDGTIVNEYWTLLNGSGVWFHKLGEKPPFKGFFQGFWGQGPEESSPSSGGFARLELQCDWDCCWRVVYRGDLAHSFTVTVGSKFVSQMMGPKKWKQTFVEDENPWEQEYEEHLKSYW